MGYEIIVHRLTGHLKSQSSLVRVLPLEGFKGQSELPFRLGESNRTSETYWIGDRGRGCTGVEHEGTQVIRRIIVTLVPLRFFPSSLPSTFYIHLLYIFRVTKETLETK